MQLFSLHVLMFWHFFLVVKQCCCEFVTKIRVPKLVILIWTWTAPITYTMSWLLYSSNFFFLLNTLEVKLLKLASKESCVFEFMIFSLYFCSSHNHSLLLFTPNILSSFDCGFVLLECSSCSGLVPLLL